MLNITHYTSHSLFTDPAEFADLYSNLPDDIPGLIQVVQNVLIHKLVVDFYQVQLSRIATGKTVYILDEPTTGLHFADIQRLLDALHRLVENSHTGKFLRQHISAILERQVQDALA